MLNSFHRRLLAGAKAREIALIFGFVIASASWLWLLTKQENWWDGFWGLLGIPAESPYFLDFAVVSSAAMAIESGLDPQVVNSDDPRQRLLNYPSVVAWWAYSLGLHTDLGSELGPILMVSVFILGAALFLRRHGIEYRWAIVVLLPSLFAIERGNLDLLALSLVLFATLSRSALTFTLLVGCASLTKVFPLVALPVIALTRRPTIKQYFAIIGVGVGLAIYLLPQLGFLSSQNAAMGWASFGLETNVQLFAAATGAPGLLGVALWLIFTVALTMLLWVRMPPLTVTGPTLEAAMVATTIYVATFLVGSQYDYRMVFLLLLLPAISKIEASWLRFLFVTVIVISGSYPLAAMLGDWALITVMFAKNALFALFAVFLIKSVAKLSRDLRVND